MGLRIGSWGTPEFGVTEWLQSKIAPQKSYTSQGGSNLLGSPRASSVPMSSPVSPYAGSRSVLGAKTSSPVGRNTTQQQPQQQVQNPDFGGMVENARSQAEIDLENALSEFDYYAEQANLQKQSLGTQKAGALSEMETSLGKSQKQAKTSKEEASRSTQSAKSKALSTAQDVTKSNRNVLRSLGILSSSAAGEMLAKPMNEYATQAADLEQGLIQRKNVVDDWLNERVAEHQTAVKNLESQYTDLIGKIDSDLRFNDRQRITAVKSAQAALQQRIQEIQNSAVQYQQAAQQYNANIISQIAQIKLYQNPQADVTSLLGTLINPQVQRPSGQTELSAFQKKPNTLSGY
jgi:hypothetical protein